MAIKREHTFLREIRDQPNAMRATIEAESHEVDQVAGLLNKTRLNFLGMGSSYFASIYASYLLAELTDSGSEYHLASEFLHYPRTVTPKETTIAISQSGESIETVKAAQLLKRKRNFIIAITNEPSSTLARISDKLILTHAGTERASATKTFASTLAVLYCLIIAVAEHSGKISERKKGLLSRGIMQLTHKMDQSAESWNNKAAAWSNRLANCRAAMIIARGPTLPGALQGALLMKEVAKIPAEGMSTGDFSHGPVEAVSKKISVIILGGGRTSRLQYQAATRSKALYASALMVSPHEVRKVDSICFGETDENLTIFPCSAILELLAYHTALRKGLNPDHFNVIHKVTTRE